MSQAPSDGCAPLSVAFIGTPAFAVPSLGALAKSSHHIQLVITVPARRAGRGLRPALSPVHIAADQLGLRIANVDPKWERMLTEQLAAVSPDVIVVVAWGGMLSREALSQARSAAINVHASLLPRWRGAAPVERAMMAGDAVTGVTIMHLAEQLDAGDILLQSEVPLPEAVSGGQALEALAQAGAGLLVQALDLLASGTAPRRPQDPGLVTWASKLTPADERITWHMPADAITRTVRALSPRPGAHFVFAGTRVKLLAARVHEPTDPGGHCQDLAAGAVPGTILRRDGDSLLVAAGERSLVWVDRVKPAGSGPMTGTAFAVGRRLAAADILAE